MVLDLIEKRFSVRNYKDKKVEDEKIKSILEAGRLAPSWMNSQPWHFIVVDKKEKKEMLSKMCMGQKHVSEASHLILMLANTSGFSRLHFGKILKERGKSQSEIDMIFENQILNPGLLGDNTILIRLMEQTTYALSYMTIEAQNQGLGCCVVGAMSNELTGGEPQYIQKIKEELNLPPQYFITAILTVGYKNDNVINEPKVKMRKSFDEVVSLNNFGEKFNN